MPLLARFAALAVLALAAPAGAEDLALILSNQTYRGQPNLTSGPATDRIERSLTAAGFAVIKLQDQTLGVTADRIAAARARAERADRLVIFVNGHVVSVGGQSWLLSSGAAEPSDLTVGARGLPLAPLMRMAAQHPGAAIVAVAEQAREPAVDPSLTPAFQPGEVPQGVTLLMGPATELAAALGDVLIPGRTMSRVLTRHTNVRAEGFIALRAAFLPETRPAAAPPPPAPPPPAAAPAPEPLSREQVLAQVEAELKMNAETRRKVQRSLAILGFDPRGIDGVIGPGTRAALRGWQADRGLEGTGYLNAAQLRRLTDEGDARAAELEEEARRAQEAAEARDAAYWRDTGQGTDEAGLRAYLRRYPDGLFADIARTRLEEIEAARRPTVSAQEERDWTRVTQEDTARAYQAYLEAYPQGAYRNEAEIRLAALDARAEEEEAARLYAGEERRIAGNSVTRKLVENRLAALGLDPGPVDGEFDADTRRALRRFQEARGLEVTGYVDQATMVRVLFGN